MCLLYTWLKMHPVRSIHGPVRRELNGSDSERSDIV